ncbi:heparinase II/III family protein [bacterium]|nr:heparinase II/III family protein [bacterium]
MNRMMLLILPAFLLLAPVVQGQTAAGDDETARRLREFAAMLEEKPHGFGHPIGDRAAWERVAAIPAFGTVVSEAEKNASLPVPELPDSLFLEFSRNGNRTNYQAPQSLRRSRLTLFTIAECIDNRGRFLPVLERYIRAVCSERTWVLPAHDRDLDNFYGRKVEIDLGQATTSLTLATVLSILGDRLSPDVRRLMGAEVRRRVFVPFLTMVQTGKDLTWWMTTTNNWNSVCLCGTAGAALAMIESREERAWFLLGVERYIPNYLSGFTDDGYCSEGLGYWNYGFGHYIMLSGVIKQATGGSWDLLENDKVRRIAQFPANLEITTGVYPAFADCAIDAFPNPRFMRFLNRRYGFSDNKWESVARSAGGTLYELALFEVSDPLSDKSSVSSAAQPRERRHWFEQAGVLIGRPPVETGSLAVALKGGHNNEHHNHNDVGSYVVVLDGKTLLLDPGSEIYTSRTFSPNRYESTVLNSFGHPVPRIGGMLQKTGEDARARVVSKRFTDDEDTLVFDLSSAYEVPGLETLERTFVYSRELRGYLTVTDRMECSTPQAFETALVTFDEWHQQPDGSLLVRNGDTAVTVSIDTGGRKYTVQAGQLREDLPSKRFPTRIGIVLSEPVSASTVTLTIRPAVK